MTPEDLIKEDLDLREKREKALEMPMNSLTKGYIKSLGKSTLEKELAKTYENFTFLEFLNHTGKS